MTNKISRAILITLGLSTAIHTTALEVNFEKGIPSGFTLVCNDGMPTNNDIFNHVTPQSTWFSGIAPSDLGTNCNVALSSSRREYDFPTDNWLITPQVSVSDDTRLCWDARSIHYDYRESYKVMISTTSTNLDDFEELDVIGQEEYFWKRRMISLAPYAGKNVYVAFVHTSQNQFLLALDNIQIGTPDKVSLSVDDLTLRTVGVDDDAKAYGSIFNTGKTIKINTLECTGTQGATDYTEQIEGKELATGDTWEFEIPLPTSLNTATTYNVMAILDDGSRIDIISDRVACSHFPRTLLVEKYTANWCTTCPHPTLTLRNLQRRFGDRVIVIEPHWANDFMQIQGYASVELYDVPTVFYNRAYKHSGYYTVETSEADQAMDHAAYGKVDVVVEEIEDGSLKAVSTVVFAENIDNSKDLYRLAYVLVENDVKNVSAQKNGQATNTGYGEYYYLPTTIPADFMVFHDLPRGTNSALMGVASSLPSAIIAGESYTHETIIDIPESVTERNNLELVAVLIRVSGEVPVINATKADIKWKEVSSIDNVTSDNNSSGITIEATSEANVYRINADNGNNYNISLIGFDGTAKAIAVGNGSTSIDLSHEVSGFYLLRVIQEGNQATKKVIIK